VEIEIIIFSTLTAIVASIISFSISKKLNDAKFDIYLEQARVKSIAIEHEAKTILTNAKLKAKEVYETEFKNAKKEYEELFSKIQRKEEEIERSLKIELNLIKEQQKELQNNNSEIKALKQGLKVQDKIYKDKLNKAIKVLENASGLTKDEAKDIMLNKVKDESKAQVASIFRKEYKLAQKKQKDEVLQILAIATSRYAGEFAAERLSTVLKLPNTDVKGKIIGKDGRNIKALEFCLGVDIIIDNAPDQITISSFNLFRRAIAIKSINLLIKDGRIQPARIEDVCKKVKNEFEVNILKEGEDTVYELGIKDMHDDLLRLIGRLRYRASYGQNALAHTLEVANLAGLIAGQLGGDPILARRAGLLHDIGKSLTHEIKGSHVDIGANLCKRYNEPDEVINAIYAHHGEEEINSIESAAVCAADALSAARPGARREVLENFLKRVEEIESICTSYPGVINTYAINAGKEVRVIVKSELVNDDESILLATQIANEIEEKVQYPGEIKVNVIRELRTTQYAR
jgi:ribonuclease Y